MCNKEAVKEVHVYKKVNRVEIIFLCEEHFKQENKWLRYKNIQREIFDLKPKVDDRIRVQFT
jgi:hypothetical protein